MPAYNGHHCWNCWNVSLWLNNDESLYSLMLYWLRRSKTRRIAARKIQADLPPRTPDGARYSLRSIIGAMEGLS